MARKSVFPACGLFLALAVSAPAQQSLPRVAVIPLNPVSISRADATAFTGLLEVALVKTEVFDVLEQSQVSVILEAQERSVSDCTDEKCAIEFGKLLAAEQIILGSISTTGGKFFLAAKVIDVTTGRSVRADTVDAASLMALTGTVELLAYKLAGLTYQAGGEQVIARSFAEVFVETVPSGAEVLLNGVSKGKSPILVQRVPVGRVTVEARNEALYAAKEMDVVAEGLNKLKLELALSVGNVFFRSSVTEGIRVAVDGTDAGELGSGLMEGLPSGEHQFALSGGGYYWEGKVTLQTGKTVSVEAYPREVGRIEYVVPVEAQAELTARDTRTVLRGSGTLENVPVQSYSVHVTGTDYEPLDSGLTVTRGQTARLAPAAQRTEAYRRRAEYEVLGAEIARVEELVGQERRLSASDVAGAEAVAARVAAAEFRFDDLAERVNRAKEGLARRAAQQESDEAVAGFSVRLEAGEALLAAGGSVVTPAQVSAAEGLAAEIAASEHRTEALLARAGALVLSTEARVLEDRKAALETRLEQARRRGRALRTAGWVVGGVGVGFGALGAVSYAMGSRAYDDYRAAATPSAAIALWEQVKRWPSPLTVGIWGGVPGLLVGSLLLLAAPRTGALSDEIEELEAQLDKLRSQGR